MSEGQKTDGSKVIRCWQVGSRVDYFRRRVVVESDLAGECAQNIIPQSPTVTQTWVRTVFLGNFFFATTLDGSTAG
jgi:hypothetical protein